MAQLQAATNLYRLPQARNVLLQTRLCDLKLSLRQSPLKPHIDQFYQELADRGLAKLRPELYLADEWFSPTGVVAIAIPFYLVDPVLVELEREMMVSVEGEGREWFLKLMRHEAGHCFDHAYRLSKTARWQDLFGNPNLPYCPESYSPRPFSRKYVRHLPGFYSQAHPIEDFAETFAVWMRGPGYWRERYQDRPVIAEKLAYIEEMVTKYGNLSPRNREYSRISAARHLRITLQDYYNRKILAEGPSYGKFADQKLRKIFHKPKGNQVPLKSWFISNEKTVVDAAVKIAGGRKYQAQDIYQRLGRRSQQLGLAHSPKRPGTHRNVVELVAELIEVCGQAKTQIGLTARTNTEGST